MDNVGIVVDSLDNVISFLTELGLTERRGRSRPKRPINAALVRVICRCWFGNIACFKQ
jgi:hypothetical protein